jgi:hypothetical protein
MVGVKRVHGCLPSDCAGGNDADVREMVGEQRLGTRVKYPKLGIGNRNQLSGRHTARTSPHPREGCGRWICGGPLLPPRLAAGVRAAPAPAITHDGPCHGIAVTAEYLGCVVRGAAAARVAVGADIAASVADRNGG